MLFMSGSYLLWMISLAKATETKIVSHFKFQLELGDHQVGQSLLLCEARNQ